MKQINFKKVSPKHLACGLSLSVMSMMTVSAHAFLVDNSQQKTIYIGKGNAQSMQAVTVQEIPPATTTIQQTRTYTNTNTALTPTTKATPTLRLLEHLFLLVRPLLSPLPFSLMDSRPVMAAATNMASSCLLAQSLPPHRI
ncbi:Uncharacterised protein [Moraxella lacunata]|uniref:Uncharacterized protein n=1 Tax=Moraxella lacunata TaxID=477 RepID=A0A378TWS1_MORLA|nr:hypothetical protein [Moraxella lacunata]STZ64372.1 Uncharacterised protein [Moraxella lacunata]